VVAALGLTLLAWIAAVAVVARLELDGRAERLVAAFVVWNGVVLLPIYVLGVAGQLHAASVGAAAAVLSLGLIAGAGWPGRRALAEPLTLARDAVGLLREHPLVGLAAIFCLALELWSVAMALLAPSWRSFDALWYHEPIIGLAIQQRGLAWADLPFSVGQLANTMLRAGELTGLWFVLFAGRRLVDLANTLFHPAMVLAVYVLVRRVSSARATAAGWALVVGLVPAFVGQLQSSYVDVQASALVLAALVLVTRPRLAARHVGASWLALALAAATKLTNAIPAALLGLVLLVRARRAWAVQAAGVVGVLLLLATTMVPNATHYGNPFYPIAVRAPALGLDWEGVSGSGKRGFAWQHLRFVYRVPGTQGDWRQFGDIPYHLPPHYVQEYLPPYNHGYVVPWLVFPFGLVAALVTLARRRGPPALWIALGIAAVTFVAIFAPLYARYHAFVVTALVMALARGLDGWPRLGRRVAGVAAAISAATLFLQDHPQVIGPRTALRMLAVPYPEREVTPAFGAPVEKEAGLARERELGPGAIVVYGDDQPQPAPLWNNAFSNRVLYVPSGDGFLARAEALGATWIFASERSTGLREELAAPGSRWERVGRLYVRTDHRSDGAVWRRR
jgi:hypothetical protein